MDVNTGDSSNLQNLVMPKKMKTAPKRSSMPTMRSLGPPTGYSYNPRGNLRECPLLMQRKRPDGIYETMLATGE